MRPYEVVLILDSTVEDSAVDGVVGRVRETLAARDGHVGQVEKWGRRRFAYEMKHRWEGYYALVEANAEPQAIADVDRMLLLSDDVIRHKIVRVPESVAGRSRQASNKKAEQSADSTGVKS